MKITFLTYPFYMWGGGVDLIRLLTQAVAAVAEQNDVECQIIVPSQVPDGGIAVGHLRSAFAKLGSRVQLVPGGDDYEKQQVLALEQAPDVVLPFMQLPAAGFVRSGVPWIGYVYDCQHRYYPNFFTDADRASRDKAFEQMLHMSKHVIVNGRAVRDDAVRFYGPFPTKLHSLPFGAWPQPEWLQSVLDVRQRYGIDRPYFMVCNQFWIHKDHPTALRAFARMIQRGGDALLVCTGQTVDQRQADYFSQIETLNEKLGVSFRVLMLGHIDKLDQIRLMRRSIALVQPTLFEGGPGGGSVYDATAIGTPAIVSDIPVNREIEADNVTFFPAGDDKALADIMVQLASDPARGQCDATKLWADGLKRKLRLGEAVLAIAREAAQG
jgi:glycosyltransferase involved in cell wall biosynthesis